MLGSILRFFQRLIRRVFPNKLKYKTSEPRPLKRSDFKTISRYDYLKFSAMRAALCARSKSKLHVTGETSDLPCIGYHTLENLFGEPEFWDHVEKLEGCMWEKVDECGWFMTVEHYADRKYMFPFNFKYIRTLIGKQNVRDMLPSVPAFVLVLRSDTTRKLNPLLVTDWWLDIIAFDVGAKEHMERILDDAVVLITGSENES